MNASDWRPVTETEPADHELVLFCHSNGERFCVHMYPADRQRYIREGVRFMPLPEPWKPEPVKRKAGVWLEPDSSGGAIVRVYPLDSCIAPRHGLGAMSLYGRIAAPVRLVPETQAVDVEGLRGQLSDLKEQAIARADYATAEQLRTIIVSLPAPSPQPAPADSGRP
jgi:hypothetical protein